MSAQTSTEKGAKSFIRGVKSDLKKVTWPTKDELLKHTLVVLFFCLFTGVLVWVVDLAFNQLLSLVMR